MQLKAMRRAFMDRMIDETSQKSFNFPSLSVCQTDWHTEINNRIVQQEYNLSILIGKRLSEHYILNLKNFNRCQNQDNEEDNQATIPTSVDTNNHDKKRKRAPTEYLLIPSGTSMNWIRAVDGVTENKKLSNYCAFSDNGNVEVTQAHTGAKQGVTRKEIGKPKGASRLSRYSLFCKFQQCVELLMKNSNLLLTNNFQSKYNDLIRLAHERVGYEIWKSASTAYQQSFNEFQLLISFRDWKSSPTYARLRIDLPLVLFNSLENNGGYSKSDGVTALKSNES
jgi:hypothetical protein